MEFVSANPTGPLHVAHGRGAVLGDSMARVLEAAGYAVQREYYVNDAGSQARTFGATLFARYQQLFGREAPIPEDGYPGEYMIDLAEEIRSEVGERYLNNDGATPELTERGVALVVESIQADLELLGVHFDHWFSESSLFEGRTSLEGQSPYEAAMGRLREAGFVSEREGAIWFTSTKLGEEKDDVPRAQQRGADLLRFGRGVSLRQVCGAQLRASDRRLGSRPPWPCGADDRGPVRRWEVPRVAWISCCTNWCI